MRTDISQDIIDEYGTRDVKPCARVTVEDDLMPFSLWSGLANDPAHYTTHDAKIFKKDGTTYILRARSDGTTLQYKLLTAAQCETAANWQSWTPTGITGANTYGPTLCQLAVAVDSTGRAQIFFFDDSYALKVTECADITAGSPTWGAPVAIPMPTIGVPSSSLVVASARLDECFRGARNVTGCGGLDTILRCYKSGVSWYVVVWPLHHQFACTTASRAGKWGNAAILGLAAVEFDGKVFLAISVIAVGSGDVPYQTGILVVVFRPGGTQGLWWRATLVEPSSTGFLDAIYHYSLFPRLSVVDEKLWLTFRREHEPTNTGQTESTQAVPRFRFVARSRSGDGYHWSQIRYVTENYQSSGPGPIFLVGDYLYMPTFNDVYRAAGTSTVGVTNEAVVYDLDECVSASFQTSGRRTPGQANLICAEASGIDRAIVKPLSRVFIELGAVHDGSPLYEQVWQGRLTNPDEHRMSEDPPLDEQTLAACDDLYQMTTSVSMDNIDHMPQERYANNLSDFSALAIQSGSWGTSTDSTWGTSVVCKQIYRSDIPYEERLGVAFLTHSSTSDCSLKVDFSIHLLSGNDHGCGINMVRAGLIFWAESKEDFFTFYYDNAADRLRLGWWYSGTFTSPLDGKQTGALGWQNNYKYSLKVLIIGGRAVCTYKAAAATTWTHAFTYYIDTAASLTVVPRLSWRCGLYGLAENDVAANQAVPYFHYLRYGGGDFDKTIDEHARAALAFADIHDFTRLRAEIEDDFADSLDTADWQTGTARRTWQIAGSAVLQAAAAGGWGELLTWETMINPVVEFDMRLTTGDVGGVIVRAADEDNYLSVVVTGGAQGTARVTFYQATGGTPTVMDDCVTACEIPSDVYVHYTLFCKDNWLVLWAGRQLLAVFYDENATYTAGFVGLCAYNCTMQFDNFRIPEMKEVIEFMTFDIGQDMLSALNSMIGQRHIQLFMDYQGRPVMGYFSERDGPEVTFSDRCFVSSRVRQRSSTHCRIHGAEGWAEYWREPELADGKYLYLDMHCPDICVQSAMYDEARYAVRRSLEDAEQINVDVWPDIRAEPEDIVTVTVNQQGVDDQYIVSDTEYQLQLGETIEIATRIGGRLYVTL